MDRWPLHPPANHAFRAVEVNVVTHRKKKCTKYCVTTGFSESGTDDSINAGIDLKSQPKHSMCKILHLAKAAAIMDSCGQAAFLWFADLEAAYR